MLNEHDFFEKQSINLFDNSSEASENGSFRRVPGGETDSIFDVKDSDSLHMALVEEPFRGKTDAMDDHFDDNFPDIFKNNTGSMDSEWQQIDANQKTSRRKTEYQGDSIANKSEYETSIGTRSKTGESLVVGPQKGESPEIKPKRNRKREKKKKRLNPNICFL